MNEWNIALGALLLVLAISAGALLSRHLHPAVSVPPASLKRPQGAGVTDLGWCPAQQAETLHAYYPDGRQCWECRGFTPGGAQ